MITSLSVVLPIKLACLGARHSSQWVSSHWGLWASSSMFSCLPCLLVLCFSFLFSSEFIQEDAFELSTKCNLISIPTFKERGIDQDKSHLIYWPWCWGGGLCFLWNAWFNCLHLFLFLEYSRTPEECWVLGMPVVATLNVAMLSWQPLISLSSFICLLLSLVRMTGRERGAASFPVCVSVGGRRRGLAATN